VDGGDSGSGGRRRRTGNGGSGQWDGGSRQMEGHGEEKEKKKKNGWFPDPAYIHRLNDEYRRAHTVSLAPPIFVGEATSLTNIGHVSSSVTWPH
jgi:hypothetical protein